MKKQILASLILATLTTSAFALPGKEQPPLTEVKAVHSSETLSENASERTKTFHVAEDGAERTKSFRVA